MQTFEQKIGGHAYRNREEARSIVIQNWRLTLLGTLSISAPDGKVFRVNRPKVAELLSFLGIRKTRIVDRDSIAEALWPEADFNSARNRLKQTLALLRQEIPDLPILVHGKNGLELDRSLIEIDVESVEGRIKWLRAMPPHEREEAARQLWEKVREGLLPELRFPWLTSEQMRFASLRDKVRSEFEHVAPETHAAFRFGDEFGGTNVPLVGRDAEIAWIDNWMKASPERYLILVGAPGVGKTRLLKEVFASEREICDASVSLSTVQVSETPWLERLGQVLGIRGRDQVTESLVQLLRGFKRPLLAIDDLDQADSVMREWIHQVCSLAPNVKVIGTARRRQSDPHHLHLDVLPLTSNGVGVDIAAGLFTRFASHFGIAPRVLEQHQASIGAIATHLEGHPLSLEVAAGWLPYMQVDRLLGQLKNSPGLVIGRAAQGRDSLTQCLAAICESLPEAERVALRKLCVCKGGCGEDLAEELLGVDWPWMLRALCDRSLVFKVEGRRGNRFVVLQAIRESVEAVEPAEGVLSAKVHHRSACYRMAELASWQINEADRGPWLDWLRDESDNVLIACSRALEDDSLVCDALEHLHRLRSGFWLIQRVSDFSKILLDLCIRASIIVPDWGAKAPSALVRYRLKEISNAGSPLEAVEPARFHTEALQAAGCSAFEIADSYDVEGETRIRAQDLAGAYHCFLEASRHFIEAGYRRHALWMEPKLAHVEDHLAGKTVGNSRRAKALDRAIEIEDFNSVGMYSKQFAKNLMAEKRWDEALPLAEQAVAAFKRVGETQFVFLSLLVVSVAKLGLGDREGAIFAVEQAADFEPVAGDLNLPDYNRLREALAEGASFDIATIDRY